MSRQSKRPFRSLGRGVAVSEADRIGRADQTGSFVAENEQLNRELTAATIPHVFRLYPGGHQQALWSSEAPTWLGLALNHLAAAR